MKKTKLKIKMEIKMEIKMKIMMKLIVNQKEINYYKIVMILKEIK